MKERHLLQKMNLTNVVSTVGSQLTQFFVDVHRQQPPRCGSVHVTDEGVRVVPVLGTAALGTLTPTVDSLPSEGTAERAYVLAKIGLNAPLTV